MRERAEHRVVLRPFGQPGQSHVQDLHERLGGHPEWSATRRLSRIGLLSGVFIRMTGRRRRPAPESQALSSNSRRGHQEVGRLDVAVNEAFAKSVLQSLSGLTNKMTRLRHRQ